LSKLTAVIKTLIHASMLLGQTLLGCKNTLR
jgi:hypothetical protein